MAVGGDLPILAGQVEAGIFLPLIGVLRLPLLIDGAVGGQLPLLGHVAGQQLVGDAGRLGEAGIKQLLHFVARLHVADKGADGKTQAHQRQDTGEQKAANGAGTFHRAGVRLGCSSWGMM